MSQQTARRLKNIQNKKMARRKTNKNLDSQMAINVQEMQMLFNSDFSDAQLEHFLNKGMIKVSEKLEKPPQILWVGDCTIATFGNFSASTGKAKSKKTFNVSAMVAAALINGTVLNYRACLPSGKRKIFYFDTEQSRYHCRNVHERILKLAGLPTNTDTENITFVGLREYTPSLRISLIDYALRKSAGYGLVIIDGLRDLMYDINNAKEATDVMTMLMSWTSNYDLHIHCVLHLNKNDSNTRGHIGTELENKAETVLIVSKDKQNTDISEVRPMHMRDKEFYPFAFHIDSNALPVLEEGYHVTVCKPKDQPLTSLPENVHKEVLDELFSQRTPEKYVDMVKALNEFYAQKGYKKGTNATKELLKLLSEKSIITKDDAGYHYNPEIIKGETSK